MGKDVHDVTIIDEQGNDITSELPREAYQIVEIIEVNYINIAHLKIKKEERLET